MSTQWYVVKVMPGKERSLSDQFNKEVSLGKIKNIIRFVCPTEKNLVVVKNKKVLREKVLYSGYLYFETEKVLGEDQLKEIALMQNIMGMMGERQPLRLRESDIQRILKDELLEEHIDAKKLKYTSGEKVIVNEGPFATFEGTITEVTGDKVNVEIKIFGRNTPVTLTLGQIAKVV
jgi:transcriptional antiterminator NusG